MKPYLLIIRHVTRTAPNIKSITLSWFNEDLGINKTFERIAYITCITNKIMTSPKQGTTN